MAKVTLSKGLIARLAGGPVRRKVERVLAAAERETQDRAPDAKAWATAADERVRHSHAAADGQTIPANLSYKLPAMAYVRKGRGPGGKAVNPAGGWHPVEGADLAAEPRDPELPAHQREQCRCESLPIGGALAAATRSTPVTVADRRVSGKVLCTFRRVAEAEFGNARDDGAHFMGAAAMVVAARYRARSRI